MSDDYNKSWNDGRFGNGPGANVNWDAYNAGQSERRMNEAALAGQADALARPIDTTPIGPKPLLWSGPSFAGPVFKGSATGPMAGASPLGGCLVLILAGFFSPAVFAVWTVLYPVAAGAATIAFNAASIGVRLFSPTSPRETRLVISAIAAILTLWPVSRFDNRLASTRPTYRWIRHGMRLLVVAGFAFFFGSRARLPLPEVAVGAAAAAVILHLVLTKTPTLRDFWHGVLANLYLGT